MTANDHNSEFEMHKLLERLVAGELDETGRSQALGWLEGDVNRWRLCGLAFLEAQAWSETLGAWTTKAPAHVEPAATRGVQDRPPSRRRSFSLVRAASVVVAVVVAFTAGVITRDMWASSGISQESSPVIAEDDEPPAPDMDVVPSPPAEGPLMATVSLSPAATGVSAAEVRFPVVKGESTSTADSSALPQLPDYVRQQWERRGYRFDAQRRYLLARLPDGEQVAVPIERLLVSYVGKKVY